jgi:hypothetical protein
MVLSSVAKQLADCQMLDPEGRTVRLGSTWEDQITVLAFIRHFG